jgi:predicted  nucleic acid-binding Zn-ribbon protein
MMKGYIFVRKREKRDFPVPVNRIKEPDRRSPLWVYPTTRDRMNALKRDMKLMTGRFMNMDEVLNEILDQYNSLSTRQESSTSGGEQIKNQMRELSSRITA